MQISIISTTNKAHQLNATLKTILNSYLQNKHTLSNNCEHNLIKSSENNKNPHNVNTLKKKSTILTTTPIHTKTISTIIVIRRVTKK